MNRWFGRIDLSAASAAEQRVIECVVDLLDQLKPARLNPRDQTIEVKDGGTWIQLRHDSEPELSIEVALSDGWVNFYGVMGHDEAYSVRSEPVDTWQSDTIQILSDLLQSDYTFSRYEFRGRLWREVISISEPYNLEVVAPFPRSLLPLWRWASKVETRRVSFECQSQTA